MNDKELIEYYKSLAPQWDAMAQEIKDLKIKNAVLRHQLDCMPMKPLESGGDNAKAD